jgi:hypothetical protein
MARRSGFEIVVQAEHSEDGLFAKYLITWYVAFAPRAR